MIPVFKPSFGEEELEALREPFETGWIGLGPKTAEFEEKFAAYVGASHAVGLNSATAALHLALAAFKIGAGDEVLVPAITFVSTAHAALYVGATPVFVDVYPDTLCMDVEDMARKITERTRAAIPVHYGGHPCELDEIMEVAKRHGIYVIEDAAHACGSAYRGHKIGSIGDATCFSFHAVKNLATGDGGMITTDRSDVARLLNSLRWVGIGKSTWERTEDSMMQLETGLRRYADYSWYYEVSELGYKYHMNDIAAAIGLVQLKKLETTNARRRGIVERYNEAFRNVDWIQTPPEKTYVRSAHHNYVIKTPFRDALNRYLKEKGIATGVHYMPIHLHPYYRSRFEAHVPMAEQVWTQLLTLPLYPDLTDEQVDYIIDSIRSFRPVVNHGP
jgi:perosamine synthetase